jgi:hypothetical protein
MKRGSKEKGKAERWGQKDEEGNWTEHAAQGETRTARLARGEPSGIWGSGNGALESANRQPGKVALCIPRVEEVWRRVASGQSAFARRSSSKTRRQNRSARSRTALRGLSI